MKLFDTACAIANDIPRTPDRRPGRLQALRDAQHPTCLYYRFFHELVWEFSPFDALEIGTYVGVSAAHLAWGNSFTSAGGVITGETLWGFVTTIDINPDAARCVVELTKDLKLVNIEPITGDSLTVIDHLGWDHKIDLLYIDGNHTFDQAYQEYVAYRQLVRHGGLIIIDDAGLEMDGDEMNVMWELITEPKARVDHLHPNVGFGIVEKRDEVEVARFDQVTGLANSMIAKRRR